MKGFSQLRADNVLPRVNAVILAVMLILASGVTWACKQTETDPKKKPGNCAGPCPNPQKEYCAHKEIDPKTGWWVCWCAPIYD